MDDDAQLSREQILREAESIRLAIQSSPSPSEKQRLRDRYKELEGLLSSISVRSTASSPSATPPKLPDSRKCPYCAETIKREAIKCRFCGEMLDGSTKPFSPVASKPSLPDQLQKAGQSMQSTGRTLISCGCLIFVAFGLLIFLGALLGTEQSSPSRQSDPVASPISIPRTGIQPAPQRPVNATPPRTNSNIGVSQSIESQIRDFASREYPNDRQMQDFVYKNQIAAYRFMSGVQDAEVKRMALNEYPNDYQMQKFTYDNQLSAKRYMSTVADREVKGIALHEYPNDYSMQKFTYDNQLSAKQYMSTLPNSAAKSRAQREYPNDYAMQKFTYDNNL